MKGMNAPTTIIPPAARKGTTYEPSLTANKPKREQNRKIAHNLGCKHVGRIFFEIRSCKLLFVPEEFLEVVCYSNLINENE